MIIAFWGIIGALLLIIGAIKSKDTLFGFGLSGIITMVFSNKIEFYMQFILFSIFGVFISLYIVSKLKNIDNKK